MWCSFPLFICFAFLCFWFVLSFGMILLPYSHFIWSFINYWFILQTMKKIMKTNNFNQFIRFLIIVLHSLYRTCIIILVQKKHWYEILFGFSWHLSFYSICFIMILSKRYIKRPNLPSFWNGQTSIFGRLIVPLISTLNNRGRQCYLRGRAGARRRSLCNYTSS